jgi:ketopantoate hydroxymethyltransferase
MAARKETKKLVTLWLDVAMLKKMDRFNKKYGLNRTDTIKAALTFYLEHLEKGIVPETKGEG